MLEATECHVGAISVRVIIVGRRNNETGEQPVSSDSDKDWVPLCPSTDFTRLGSQLSSASCLQLGDSLSVLSAASFGNSLSTRSFVRLGSGLSVFDLARLGSRLSVLNVAHLGSSFSIALPVRETGRHLQRLQRR